MVQKKVILAVDDMPSNLMVIQSILEPYFDVRLAKSGKQALFLLTHDMVELVLLDIEMPDVNGFDILENIRQNQALKNLPVIFVTAHANADFIKRAVEVGVNDYIVKPYKPNILLEKIMAQLDLNKPVANRNNTSI
jgi:putative two-component system response regulator